MDSELIPLESGETCVAAIMTAQSENSKLKELIPGYREHIVANSFSHRVARAVGRTIVHARHSLQ